VQLIATPAHAHAFVLNGFEDVDIEWSGESRQARGRECSINATYDRSQVGGYEPFIHQGRLGERPPYDFCRMGQIDIDPNAAHSSDYKTYRNGSQGEPLTEQDLSENLVELVVPEKLNRYTRPAPRLPLVDVNTQVPSSNVRLTAYEPVSLAPEGSLTRTSQSTGANPPLWIHRNVSNLPRATLDH